MTFLLLSVFLIYFGNYEFLQKLVLGFFFITCNLWDNEVTNVLLYIFNFFIFWELIHLKVIFDEKVLIFKYGGSIKKTLYLFFSGFIKNDLKELIEVLDLSRNKFVKCKIETGCYKFKDIIYITDKKIDFFRTIILECSLEWFYVLILFFVFALLYDLKKILKI